MYNIKQKEIERKGERGWDEERITRVEECLNAGRHGHPVGLSVLSCFVQVNKPLESEMFGICPKYLAVASKSNDSK